jgi:hypothetical protein
MSKSRSLMLGEQRYFNERSSRRIRAELPKLCQPGARDGGGCVVPFFCTGRKLCARTPRVGY